jgi:hypothetical protein
VVFKIDDDIPLRFTNIATYEYQRIQNDPAPLPNLTSSAAKNKFQKPSPAKPPKPGFYHGSGMGLGLNAPAKGNDVKLKANQSSTTPAKPPRPPSAEQLFNHDDDDETNAETTDTDDNRIPEILLAIIILCLWIS